jgi:hypothetical protein
MSQSCLPGSLILLILQSYNSMILNFLIYLILGRTLFGNFFMIHMILTFPSHAHPDQNFHMAFTGFYLF